MKILMIGGGEKPSMELFNEYKKKSDYSIAIDSGLDVFFEFGEKPDYVVGDFDSTKLSKEEIKEFNFIEYPAEKNYTDSELAIEKALEFGDSEVYLLGMTGGRLDHFLGNIGIIKRALDKGIKAFLINDKNLITMTEKNIELNNIGKKYISFYAYGSIVKGLTLQGCKYELKSYNLSPFEGICNSNEFLSEKMSVEFEEGTLIIIYSQD